MSLFDELKRIAKETEPPWARYRGKYQLVPCAWLERETQIFKIEPNAITGHGIVVGRPDVLRVARGLLDAGSILGPMSDDEFAAILAYGCDTHGSSKKRET